MDNRLRFETTQFESECRKILDREFDERLSGIKDKIFDAVDSHIKQNIMKSIGTKEMYDYSGIPVIDITEKDFSDLLHLSNDNIHHKCKLSSDKQKFIDKFVQYKESFVEHERIIFKNCFVLVNNRHDNDYIYDISIITNHCRVLTVTQKHYLRSYGIPQIKIDEYNYWMPTDIINTIKFFIRDINNCTYDYNIKPLLTYVKNTSYDRKIIPPYALDIIKENSTLKAKIAQLEKEIIELYNNRTKTKSVAKDNSAASVKKFVTNPMNPMNPVYFN